MRGACKPDFVPRISPVRRPFIWTANRFAASSCQPGPLGRSALPGPKAWTRDPYSALLPVGLAMRGTLPPPRCALTAPFHPGPRERGWFVFCGAVRRVAPPGRYPAPSLRGVRTFLDLAAAVVRPPARFAGYAGPGRASMGSFGQAGKRMARSEAMAASIPSRGPSTPGRKRRRNAASRVASSTSDVMPKARRSS